MYMKKAVILLSGGADSSTALYIACAEGYQPYCLSFDYGQRNKAELEAAKRVVASCQEVAEHKIMRIGISDIAPTSALTSTKLEVPKHAYHPDNKDIPVTYVPGRNLMFLSCGVSYAESIGAEALFIGANVVDYSNYPDCRPEFLEAFAKAANMGTTFGSGSRALEIKAPLINMTKKEIIELGKKLGLDYSLTLSCYDPMVDGSPCGSCDSCTIRQQAFDAINGL
jgi:7-cyano-7-deazaguanine synthase